MTIFSVKCPKMKSGTIAAVITVAAVMVFLSACVARQSQTTENIPNPVELISADGDVDKILTKEQMLFDYDAMWDVMKENYPFFGVLSRKNPDAPDYYNQVITDYRHQIETMESDGDTAMWEFLTIISGSLYDVCGGGHVGILNPRYFREMDFFKQAVNEMPELQPWVDVISRPEVIEFYEYYDYLLTLLPKQGDSEKPSEEMTEFSEETPQAVEGAGQEYANLTLEKIPGEKTVAYIKVDSFEDSLMEEELPRIQTFMEEIQNYDHLIIDIRNNQGGNAVYWENAFVRPNLSEPMTFHKVRLMKDTEMALHFYGFNYENSKLSVEMVKNNPAFTELPMEDMQELTLAMEFADVEEPLYDEKLFQGKIWVLIGPSVFSSSESFAVFCKETGFATLVGEHTGGSDSGGPIVYELPSSHLLMQFDVEYCLNPDGSCSMEMGTPPDIESEDALGTVLELIEKTKGAL